MRRGTRALAFAVATATLLAMAPTVVSASAPAKAKPAAYAKSVCSSLDSWLTKIESASAQASAAPPTTPAQGKKALLKLVGSAVNATKALVGKLKKTGPPAVEGGADVQSIVVGQFKQVQSTLTNARKSLKQLPADDPVAFVAQSRTAQDAVEAGLESVQAALNAASALDVAPLVKAFNAQATCQQLTD
ncbi:MAG: hypothetical protein WD598_15455 [Acidimicrobiia bacterium]